MCSPGDPDSGFGCEGTKTRLFHCLPHMLGSSNVNQPPILQRRRVKRGGFTILEEDPTIYPHTFLFPVLLLLTGQRSVFTWLTRVPPLILSKMLSTCSTNAAVASYSLQHIPEYKKTKLLCFLMWWITVMLYTGKITHYSSY
jgi:hypothetical protein